MKDHTRADEPSPPSPQRIYADRPATKLRDVDAGEQMVRRKAALWGTVIGAVGIPISLLLAAKVGADPPLNYLFLLGGPIAGVAVYQISTRVTMGTASLFGRIHNPKGDSTPAIKEYSRPQALTAQGRYREAIEEYEDLVTLNPEDPEPYVRIARLFRDRLGDFDHAISWFKRARSAARISMGLEVLVTQEIIEIYRQRLDEPRKAIPELARMLDRYPSHPSADEMRRELADLRRNLIDRS